LQDDFQALPEHILGDQFQQLDPASFTGLSFWTQDYVGLGPYRVAAWEPGTAIDGAAFDGFVLGRPKIDRIHVQFFTDSNTAVAALLAGQVQFIGDFVFSATDGVTLEQRWSADTGRTVLYAPVELRVSQIQLLPEYADPQALLDVRVLKALAYAID